jgi:ubiquinol-cytochrome c reductase cytochrome c1 subunit
MFSSHLAMSQPNIIQHVHINVHDQPSLQRGAMLFMNYCSGCHSLKYLRYQQMGEDLGLTNNHGQVDEHLIKQLMFTQSSLQDPIQTAMPISDATRWFGMMPPDLSLTARAKGADWIYTYLKSFYIDNTRPVGSNNGLIPDSAMPNMVDTLLSDATRLSVNRASQSANCSMTGDVLDEDLKDIVTFLAYAAEPAQLTRYMMGSYVLGLLFVLAVLVFILRK